ncbi:MAG: adenylate/guanylate cyclase domain-containing protein [Armatimonadetes bacterium]|nr:adenylate/guanylate cyclase domain-containing protein [Armatimonadota bacterium]
MPRQFELGICGVVCAKVNEGNRVDELETRTEEIAGVGKRRLAAILFTDAVGFSALANTNEPQALQWIEQDIAAMKSCSQEAGGQVIKNTGDGLLMVFASAVDAVSCGLRIQGLMSGRDEGLEHRIGIHTGDVVLNDGDVVGDGVNVSARLMGLAGPGQLYCSRAVVDLVQGKVPFESKNLGKKSLKNITDPVQVYSIWSSDLVAARPKKPIAWAQLLMIGFILVAVLLMWQLKWTRSEVQEARKEAETAVATPTSWRDNLSPDQQVEAQEATARFEFEKVLRLMAVSEPVNEEQYDATFARFSNLLLLKDWLIDILKSRSKEMPLIASGQFAGEDYDLEAWMEGEELMVLQDGSESAQKISDVPPWMFRALALSAVDEIEEMGEYSLIAGWIIDFSAQYDLPVPTALTEPTPTG